jgi:hypothetical protein
VLDEPATSGKFRLRQQTNQKAAESHQDTTQQSPPHQELRLPFRQLDRAVARKSAMVDVHWRFKKIPDIGLRFGRFSLPWKH